MIHERFPERRFIGNPPLTRVGFRWPNDDVALGFGAVFLDRNFRAYPDDVRFVILFNYMRIRQENFKLLDPSFNESLFVFGGLILGVQVNAQITAAFNGFVKPLGDFLAFDGPQEFKLFLQFLVPLPG